MILHNEEEKKGSEDAFGFSDAIQKVVPARQSEELDDFDEDIGNIDEYTPSMNQMNQA